MKLKKPIIIIFLKIINNNIIRKIKILLLPLII